jgi:hypothetical protein
MNFSLVPATAKPLNLEIVDPMAGLPLFEAQDRLPTSHFRGRGVRTVKDESRLGGLYRKVFDLMKDQHWRTLREIQLNTGGLDGSISRMLRYMDDPYVGGHHKENRQRAPGLWEYRIIPRGTNAFNNWLRGESKP